MKCLQACFKCLVAFSWTPELPLRHCVFYGWSLLSCGGSCLAQAGFPREGVFGHKPVPTRGLFPFVAFSVPEANKKKGGRFQLIAVSSHRPFPVAAWFLPEGVSGRRLTTRNLQKLAANPWELFNQETFRKPRETMGPDLFACSLPESQKGKMLSPASAKHGLQWLHSNGVVQMPTG